MLSVRLLVRVFGVFFLMVGCAGVVAGLWLITNPDLEIAFNGVLTTALWAKACFAGVFFVNAIVGLVILRRGERLLGWFVERARDGEKN